jgi:hypothetical protein
MLDIDVKISSVLSAVTVEAILILTLIQILMLFFTIFILNFIFRETRRRRSRKDT